MHTTTHRGHTDLNPKLLTNSYGRASIHAVRWSSSLESSSGSGTTEGSKRDGRLAVTFNILWNFLYGIADQAKYQRAHRLLNNLNNNPLITSASRHIHGFLGKTADRFKQVLSKGTPATEGIDAISRDTYTCMRRALDQVLQLNAAAADGRGRLDPAQFSNLPLDDMAKAREEESQQGRPLLSTTCPPRLRSPRSRSTGSSRPSRR